jgi:hypothetical protein
LLSGLGTALFLGVISVITIVDWRGTQTLCGLIGGPRIRGKKRFWLIAAWIFVTHGIKWPGWPRYAVFGHFHNEFEVRQAQQN